MLRMKICFATLLLVAVAASPVLAQQPLANPFQAGYLAVVPEQAFETNGVANGGNWEPYADSFGDGTLGFAAGREDNLDQSGTERAYVALFDSNNNVAVVDGFYTETNFPNDPWVTTNDTVRANGNPPRLAGDKRPGGTRYMLGNEATPWDFGALFPNFSPGMVYLHQTSCVQLFDRTGLSITPASLLEDPMFAPGDTGPSNNQRRFGGDIRGLSNGGWVAIVESNDSSSSPTVTSDMRWCPMTIYDHDGVRQLGPINANHINPTERTTGWSNLAAYNGGFANFPSSGTNNGSGNPTIQFWTNAGAPDGVWERTIRTDINDPLAPATASTSISTGGGQSSSRLNSHIASGHIYYCGPGIGLGGANTGVYVTKIDATTKLTVKEAFVNDTFSSPVERVMCAVDSNDNVVVVWSTGAGDNHQMLARIYDGNLDPITDAFYAFENSNLNGFSARRPTCAIADDGRILIAGRFELDPSGVYPAALPQDQVAVVISLPPPPGASVDNWDLLD